MNKRQRRVAAHPAEVAPEHGRRSPRRTAAGAVMRTASFDGPWLARERQEDVIEVGGLDDQLADVDRGAVEPVEELAKGAGPSVVRDLEGHRLLVGRRGPEDPRGPLELPGAGEREPDVSARHEPLELRRRPLGHHLATVEDGDRVGEAIGLVEVLGGQEDGHTRRDELPDDLPHDAPASRVEPCRRLVEEDDPGIADERHGQVEAPAHAAGVGRRPAASPPRRGRTAPAARRPAGVPRACRGGGGPP